MAKKKGVAQKMAVKNYLVENMVVNNLWVCNMAKIKYKVENELPFQNTELMLTQVRKTINDYRRMIHTWGIGIHWL